MKISRIIYFLFFAICFAVCLHILYFQNVKNSIKNDLLGIQFVVDSGIDLEADLYYSYAGDFSEKFKIKDVASNRKDTLLFYIPNQNKGIKKFRLDLGSDKRLNEVKIKELSFILKKDTIILDQEEIFGSLFLTSSAIILNDNHIIHFNKKVEVYDPYIIFKPLPLLIISAKGYHKITMLMLFVLAVFFCVFKYVKWSEVNISEVLIVLFVICIPLKIAWTTLCTLILTAYSLIILYKRKDFKLGTSFEWVFLILFFIPLLLGRPTSISAIDKSFGLLFFFIIGKEVLNVPKMKYYQNYVYVFMILMSMMIASGVSFLLSFFDFYHLNVVQYFYEVKTFNGHIKDWLYYNHSTFLSFFALAGLLFANSLAKKKVLKRDILYVYQLLLFLFLLFLGSRVAWFIFLIFNLNFLLKLKGKKLLFFNSMLFIFTTFAFLYNIEALDTNRYGLWKVSWEAIKERYLFGYGLGSSDEILNSMGYLKSAGFSKTLGFNHSHNQFITFILEIGLIGFLSVLCGFYFLFKKRNPFISFDLCLFVFGLGYLSLTESILETSKPLYVVCFLLLMIYKFKKVEFFEKYEEKI